MSTSTHSSTDQAVAGMHGIRGPQGFTWGSDFTDGRWVGDWVITENGDAAAPAAGDQVDEEAGGALLVTSGSGDNDSLAFQSGGEFVKMLANKKYWMTCRFKVQTANDCDFLVGFGAYDAADALETPGNVVDGVYWQSLDGSTDVDFVTEKAGTQVDTSGLGAALVDDTYIKVDFIISMGPNAGEGLVRAYYDDVKVHESYSVVLPTEVVGPFFYLATGSGNVKTATLDYVFMGGDR